MQPNDEQIAYYEGHCALCKYFRGAYQRDGESNTLWLDDEGWCVRFPPVFVGGDKDNTNECEQKSEEDRQFSYAEAQIQTGGF